MLLAMFGKKERQKHHQGKKKFERPGRRKRVPYQRKEEVGLPWNKCIQFDQACVWNSSEMRLFV